MPQWEKDNMDNLESTVIINCHNIHMEVYLYASLGIQQLYVSNGLENCYDEKINVQLWNWQLCRWSRSQQASAHYVSMVFAQMVEN